MHNNPQHAPLCVTTSWDDGAPTDLRLADLLDKHGAHGTFYIPNRNSEGRAVLARADVRLLGQGFEIGGHTLDHVVLTTIPAHNARRQIVGNKRSLEELLGREVSAFAYVRGRYNDKVRTLVKEAGFRLARTVRTLASEPGNDPLQTPTTIQVFAHPPDTYLRNFLSGGPSVRRAAVMSRVLTARGVADRCLAAAGACARRGGHFHLWGHSWEIDQHDLWRELDRLLHGLRKRRVRFLTNSEWYGSLSPEAAPCPISTSAIPATRRL